MASRRRDTYYEGMYPSLGLSHAFSILSRPSSLTSISSTPSPCMFMSPSVSVGSYLVVSLSCYFYFKASPCLSAYGTMLTSPSSICGSFPRTLNWLVIWGFLWISTLAPLRAWNFKLFTLVNPSTCLPWITQSWLSWLGGSLCRGVHVHGNDNTWMECAHNQRSGSSAHHPKISLSLLVGPLIYPCTHISLHKM